MNLYKVTYEWFDSFDEYVMALSFVDALQQFNQYMNEKYEYSGSHSITKVEMLTSHVIGIEQPYIEK